MPRLLFANAAFLAGLAALAIPILIHLFLRRKRVRLRFSTLRFFVKHNEQDQRRRRLLNWLLLATRLLLLALVVLAFARPYLLNSPASSGPRASRQIVFVLDRSASMQATDGGVTRWSKAKEIVRQTVGELGFGDRVALVDGTAELAPMSALVPPHQLKRQIEQLEPGFGGGDLGDGLQQALKLLLPQARGGQPSIFIISDLQRQSCQKLDSISVPQNVELKVFSVGKTNTPNLAVSDLVLRTRQNSLQATVADFSHEDAKEVSLEWVIDGHATASPSIALPVDLTTNATVALPALKPGWHKIEVRLQPHDRFSLDDTRCLVIQAPSPLNVLCVESRQAKHVFEEESFFLASALQPGDSNSWPALFHVEKVAPDALVDKLVGTLTVRYQIVLVPALRQLPEGCGRALLEFARRGGGVLLFLGDGLSASRYNAELDGLLPATLGRTEGELAAFENQWRLGDYESGSMVFAAFRQPGSGDLTRPEFWRRCALTPVQGAQVLARFGDGTPFLFSRSIGQGRVALVNTSANTSWSDWPKHKTFVPWLHGLCHYLAGDELSLGTRTERSFVTGTLGELELGAGCSRQTFHVRPPSGSDLVVKADDQGKLQLPLEKPGFYAVLNSGGEIVRLLAANPPQRESELAALTVAEFQQQLVRSQAITNTGVAADLIDPVDDQRNLWRLLMFAGVVALVFETVLANRTYA